MIPRRANGHFGSTLELVGPARPDWMSDPTRHCADLPTAMFFPEEPGRSTAKPAVNVCRGCPFTWECLEWAMTHNERGVWAGTTENQRTAMRRIAKEMDKRVG